MSSRKMSLPDDRTQKSRGTGCSGASPVLTSGSTSCWRVSRRVIRRRSGRVRATMYHICQGGPALSAIAFTGVMVSR